MLHRFLRYGLLLGLAASPVLAQEDEKLYLVAPAPAENPNEEAPEAENPPELPVLEAPTPPERCCTPMQQAMLNDLDNMRNIIESHYAPRHWKKSYMGWDLDEEIEKAKDKVLSADKLSVKVYQRALRDLFMSMSDYHVNIRFHSTEKAVLPFQVESAGGRYYFHYINRDQLSPLNYPIMEGDELVTFDGRPVDQVVQEIKLRELCSTKSGTDQALAERMLTARSGATGALVPRGPVSITVRSHVTGKESSYQLIWDYTPEKVKDIVDGQEHRAAKRRPIMAQKPKNPFMGDDEDMAQHPFFARPMMTSWADILDVDSGKEENANPHALGAHKSFIPPLGKILWEAEPNDRPFYWYIYETPDRRRIGYVRIPHYGGLGRGHGLGGVDIAVKRFSQIIEKMEDLTDAMVIDQVNNPGGYKAYFYALASMLTEKPLYSPKERIAITQEEVQHAIEALEYFDWVTDDEDAQMFFGGRQTLMGLPVNYQFVRFFVEYCHFIIDQWNEGNMLTEPTHWIGVDQINPHPRVRYTKPILLLVNHLDFSGGDYFPAVLQDNKRVTVFGTRTAGAGGFVYWENYPNAFGVSGFSLTGSLAERIDKNPIENLGVTPDIEYEMSVVDMHYGYLGYVLSIQAAVNELLEGDNNKPKQG